MKNIFKIAIVLFTGLNYAQTLNGEQLLNQAIKHHDPSNKWEHFKGNLNVTMKMPKGKERNSKITINLPEEYFKVIAKRDTVTSTYIMEKGKCIISNNDSIRIANLKEKPKRSHCEMTSLYKDYYTYLYGLPMKLKDEGTNLAETVEKKTFKGKTYLVLKVTYNETVGSDVWYFYFNPKTYEMEIYQFFKTDENGKMKKDSGEYILLTEEVEINNIKFPKNRAWYYNKNDSYLGTDYLSN